MRYRTLNRLRSTAELLSVVVDERHPDPVVRHEVVCILPRRGEADMSDHDGPSTGVTPLARVTKA